MECVCPEKPKEITVPSVPKTPPFLLEKSTSTTENMDIRQPMDTHSVASQYSQEMLPKSALVELETRENEIKVLLGCSMACKKLQNASENASFLLCDDGVNKEDYVMVPGPIYVPRGSVTFTSQVAAHCESCCDGLETYSTIHNKADHVEHTTSLCSEYVKKKKADEEMKLALPELKSGVIITRVY